LLASSSIRCSLPPAAPREDSAAGRVAHRCPQQPPSVAEHQQTPPVWHAKRPGWCTGGADKNQPRHMRARLAPPPAAASRPTPGFRLARPPHGLTLTWEASTQSPEEQEGRRVQSSRDSSACRPSGQNETILAFACTAVSCQGSLVSPSRE
jgi:hypothetical protein